MQSISRTFAATAVVLVMALTGCSASSVTSPATTTGSTSPTTASPSPQNDIASLQFDDGSEGSLTTAANSDGTLDVLFHSVRPLSQSAVVEITAAQQDAGTLTLSVSRNGDSWKASRPMTPGEWNLTVTVSEDVDGFVSTTSAVTNVSIPKEHS